MMEFLNVALDIFNLLAIGIWPDPMTTLPL